MGGHTDNHGHARAVDTLILAGAVGFILWLIGRVMGEVSRASSRAITEAARQATIAITATVQPELPRFAPQHGPQAAEALAQVPWFMQHHQGVPDPTDAVIGEHDTDHLARPSFHVVEPGFDPLDGQVGVGPGLPDLAGELLDDDPPWGPA